MNIKYLNADLNQHWQLYCEWNTNYIIFFYRKIIFFFVVCENNWKLKVELNPLLRHYQRWKPICMIIYFYFYFFRLFWICMRTCRILIKYDFDFHFNAAKLVIYFKLMMMMIAVENKKKKLNESDIDAPVHKSTIQLISFKDRDCLKWDPFLFFLIVEL